MLKWTATLLRFNKKGEKTSWTYIELTPAQAQKLKPASKTSFRVKGKIDQHKIDAKALIPMGGGKFILPIKSEIRKAIGKDKGDKVTVQLELDAKPRKLSSDLVVCLKEEPAAYDYFKSLPSSHQFYFSTWIESAKTIETKTKRITMAVIAMSRKMDYGAMLRAYRDDTL